MIAFAIRVISYLCLTSILGYIIFSNRKDSVSYHMTEILLNIILVCCSLFVIYGGVVIIMTLGYSLALGTTWGFILGLISTIAVCAMVVIISKLL